MSDLKDLVKQIESNKKLAETPVDGGNPSTLVGRMGRKRAASQALEQLYVDYKNSLKNQLAVILVVGDQAGQFADIAESHTGSYSESFDGLFTSLVDKINPVYYSGKESTVSMIEALSDELEVTAKAMDVMSFPALASKQKYQGVVRNKQEMVFFAKRVINEQVGPEMAALDVLEKLTKKAISDLHSEKVLVSIVKASDLDAEAALSGLTNILGGESKVLVITTGKSNKSLQNVSGYITNVSEVNNDSTLEALEQVRKRLLGKNNKKSKKVSQEQV